MIHQKCPVTTPNDGGLAELASTRLENGQTLRSWGFESLTLLCQVKEAVEQWQWNVATTTVQSHWRVGRAVYRAVVLTRMAPKGVSKVRILHPPLNVGTEMVRSRRAL